MANTLVGQTAYSIWTDPNQQQAQTYSTSGSLYQTTYTPGYAYYVQSDAEKAGKALAIIKRLEAEGVIQIDSVRKFCELIDLIAGEI